jgi:flagellar biosynthesis/type III secretory pathway protein FliH
MVLTTAQGSFIIMPIAEMQRLVAEAAEEARKLGLRAGYQEGLADASRVREVRRG